MTRTYKDYLKEPFCIPMEECQILHKEMLSEIRNDEDAIELYNELIEKAIEYFTYRANWTIKDKQWKMDKDDRRTSKHDSVIIHFDMLARYLISIGKSAMWRDQLGHVEDDKYYRKRIGDFGCYLAFVHAMSGR